VSTAALPGPLRHFTAQLDELRSGPVPDMDRVGRHLAELAADTEFFAPLIAEIPSEAPGDRWLIRPERGPRLVLVHRPAGVMGYTHSHRCWVGIAPVRGVETHQRWDAVCHRDGRAGLRLVDERALRRGDVATLVPPRDVHNHGHVPGTGPSPYSLATCVSLTVFILAGQPGGGQQTPVSKHWLSAALACCVGAAALAVLARWGSPGLRAALYGAAAAVMWALVATFIKATTDTLTEFGVSGMFARWPIYALAAGSVAAPFSSAGSAARRAAAGLPAFPGDHRSDGQHRPEHLAVRRALHR
jgi:hypothetical protein